MIPVGSASHDALNIQTVGHIRGLGGWGNFHLVLFRGSHELASELRNNNRSEEGPAPAQPPAASMVDTMSFKFEPSQSSRLEQLFDRRVSTVSIDSLEAEPGFCDPVQPYVAHFHHAADCSKRA